MPRRRRCTCGLRDPDQWSYGRYVRAASSSVRSSIPLRLVSMSTGDTGVDILRRRLSLRGTKRHDDGSVGVRERISTVFASGRTGLTGDAGVGSAMSASGPAPRRSASTGSSTRPLLQGLAGAGDAQVHGVAVDRALGRRPARAGRDQRVDVVGDRRTMAAERRRGGDVGVDVRVRDLDRRLAGVRLASGEQLEQHDACRVHVRARRRATGRDELRRDVRDGADQEPRGRGHGLAGDGLGEAEVGDLDDAAVGDHDVLRLHVAVHESDVVGGGKRLHDRLDVRQRLLGRHRRFLGDDLAQRAALDVLHDDVRTSAVAALVEDGDDVGVGEPGCGTRLAVELPREVEVVPEALVHDLHGDDAVEPGVESSVDSGHSAARQFLDESITIAEDVPDQRVVDGRDGAHMRSRHGWGSLSRAMAEIECRSRRVSERPATRRVLGEYRVADHGPPAECGVLGLLGRSAGLSACVCGVLGVMRPSGAV